ncbi:hypothetical protein WJX73_004906 [Symbiochloris irregularis]|uniref:Pex N-terminal domain-containing protein n=1 Tax=Symbiochloris irregularis TaxID=706552 RepID=A0AAW1P7F5_9CHLO
MTHAIQEKLSREVLRKLRLATEAEDKDDREIICGEVFADVTGSLDDLAREKLGIDRDCRFYEILAPYFHKTWDAAEALLYVCRRLWGQPYIAPVYTLLLHRWLLLHKDAGGQLQRQKHVNVLVSGARQLIWGDVHSSAPNFRPLYDFLAREIVLATDRSHLPTLPGPSWVGLLTIVAAFLPFYYPAEELAAAIDHFPGPDQRHARHRLSNGHRGEGADMLVGELADTLRQMRTEASLLRYLKALLALQRSTFLTHTRRITRIRLQAELYSLTSRGGPRYLPRSVNAAAFQVLGALFPAGHRSRSPESPLATVGPLEAHVRGDC